MKTVKEEIVEKYGSIGKFLDEKLDECKGKLPITRQHLYRIINHKTNNPGIKSLNALSKLTGIPKEKIYKEYSE